MMANLSGAVSWVLFSGLKAVNESGQRGWASVAFKMNLVLSRVALRHILALQLTNLILSMSFVYFGTVSSI